MIEYKIGDNMKHKGFTLVEMLAVVAVIGILVVMVAPNVLKNYRDAKKVSFIDEAKIVYEKATDSYVLAKAKGNRISYISNNPNDPLNELNLENIKDSIYTITIDKKGKVIQFVYRNNQYCIYGVGDFLPNYTKEDVIDLKDIGSGLDPVSVQMCNASFETHQPGTKLTLNLLLKRQDASYATPHIPNKLTLSYGEGWYDGDVPFSGDLTQKPSRKNYYYTGSTTTDGVEVIGCDGELLLDERAIVLFPDLKKNSADALANFVKKRFTIRFNISEGIGGSMATYTCDYGSETCKLPANTLTKTGYTFRGWKYNENIYEDDNSEELEITCPY